MWMRASLLGLNISAWFQALTGHKVAETCSRQAATARTRLCSHPRRHFA
jgi:hypothetical protein